MPSHDTFGRVCALILPDEFQACFTRWIQAVALKTPGQVIPIDGKTWRRSHDRRRGPSAIQRVSAGASANRLGLGPLKTEAKSNDLTAIPELLQVLDISGGILTIDAMGGQKRLADLIIQQEADDVLALKANHEHLFQEGTALLAQKAVADGQDPAFDDLETKTKDHGRWAIRRDGVTDELSTLKHTAGWTDIRLLGRVESERTARGKTTVERRYYGCRLEKEVALFAKAVRGHGDIENFVHWVLDMAFREDESRVRKAHAPENRAVLRPIALN